jgi:hypothetical protein
MFALSSAANPAYRVLKSSFISVESMTVFVTNEFVPEEGFVGLVGTGI